MRSMPKSLRRALLWLFRIVAALVVLVAGALFAIDLYGRIRLRATEQELLASGTPLEIEAFLEPLAEGEPNGSDILDAIAHTWQAFQQSESLPFAWSDVDLEAMTTNDELRGSVEEWLGRPAIRIMLELFDLGAETETARYLPVPAASATLPGRVADYSAKRLPMLQLARLLRARAYLAAHRSQPEDAYRNVAQILRLSHWMYQECPALLPWLLGTEVSRVGIEGVEELMQTHQPTAVSRMKIEIEIDALEHYVRTGLPSERAYIYHLRRVARAFSAPPPGSGTGTSVHYFFLRRLESLWTTSYLEGFQRLIELSEIPPSDRPAQEEESFVRSPSPFYRGPIQMLIPSLYDAISKADEQTLRLQLTRLALASSDPSSTEENFTERAAPWRKNVPSDPFSGDPLLWGGDDGCTLYSVGVNRRDEGGEGSRVAQRTEQDDISWRLPCAVREWLGGP